MKHSRVLLAIAFATVCCYQGLSGQVVLNPGLKLGYTFGETGGFTWGFEVSITGGDGPWYGGVVDIDFCKERTKLHVGFQGSMVVGASIGPAWIWENEEKDIGLSVIPFAGFMLYPYYAFTLRAKKPDIHEVGGYLKIPMAIRGDPAKL